MFGSKLADIVINITEDETALFEGTVLARRITKKKRKRAYKCVITNRGFWFGTPKKLFFPERIQFVPFEKFEGFRVSFFFDRPSITLVVYDTRPRYRYYFSKHDEVVEILKNYLKLLG